MVYVAIGCYKFQGQEILAIYDNRKAAEAHCEAEKDNFHMVYVMDHEVLTNFTMW